MTGRERFRETMCFGKPDRVPYFEEGIRPEVLEAWQDQGMRPGVDLYHHRWYKSEHRVPVLRIGN